MSIHRRCTLIIVLTLCWTLHLHAADLAPQRLALLRGAIALVEGDSAAVTDLRQVARTAPEDWSMHLLYGEALVLAGQTGLGRGHLRLATMLAPWRPEPWQALIRTGVTTHNDTLESAGWAGLARILPDDPEVARRQALLARQQGQLSDADTLTARWQRLLPPLELGAPYVVAGQIAEAADLRVLAGQDPNNAVLWQAIAGAEYRAGNLDAAYQALLRLRQLLPADRHVLTNLVNLGLQVGKIDETLDVLHSAAAGDEILERCQAAWDIAGGHYAKAVPPLTALLAHAPADAAINRQLGEVELLTGDAAGAVSAWRTAWDVQPDDCSGQQYAMALLADGQPRQAEAALNLAIQRFPRESMLKVVLAQFYQQTGRGAESAGSLEALARVRPEGAALLLLAGERDLASGDVLQTRLLAKRLRDEYPTDTLAATGAIRLFKLLDDPADAQMVFTRTLGPNIVSPLSRVEVLLESARLAVDDNQLDEAHAALNEILLEDPSCRPAYQFLGTLCVQQTQWARALAVYRDACAHWPNDGEFTLALARTARQAGNLLEARDAYLRATALPPVAADAWLELGAVARQLGDLRQARHAWQSAAALPAGALRATWLLAQTGDDTLAARAHSLATLRAALESARTARRARWRDELATRGILATEDELNALLLLTPDLLDPAMLPTATASPR